MLRYLPFLIVLAVWIYAFIDCLNTPEQEVRKLPKVAWAIIVLLFGQVLVGPIAWFAVGRPRKNAPYGAVKPQERQWVAPDDNPDFLNSLKNNGGTKETGSSTESGADGPESEHRDADASGPTASDESNTGGGEADDLRRWEEDLRDQDEDLHHRDNGNGPDDPPPQGR